MVRTIPPSFVEIGPKLRVVAPLKWEWPKMAKNRGEPQKMTGEDFLSCQPIFFTETAVTPERKVEKWFPRWEINRHAEG